MTTISPELRTITDFFTSIQLPWKIESLTGSTFMPGVAIRNGVLVIDTAQLLYPGDVLHEAGHLAVAPMEKRRDMDGNVGNGSGNIEGEEIAAQLWSYAALHHLGFPPAFVFHEHGYRGQSDWFIENFSSGTYMGLPLLEWMGLTLSPQKAKVAGVDPFPHMVKWLRD